MRRRAVLPFVLLLALVGAAPASAQTLYLQGSGQLGGRALPQLRRDRGRAAAARVAFGVWGVHVARGGDVRLGGTGRCRARLPDRRGQQRRPRLAGLGAVRRQRDRRLRRDAARASGYVPGAREPGAGRLHERGQRAGAERQPHQVRRGSRGADRDRRLRAADGRVRRPGPFTAFAGLNGDDADKVTLALYPGGGPVPIFTTTAVHGADGLDAQADVPALPPGPYTATWTITRHDGSTATASSAFTLLARPRPIVPLRAPGRLPPPRVHPDALGPHLRRPRALRRAPAPPSRAARRHARAARRRACARDGAPAERVVRAPAARSGPREHELGRAGAVQAALSRLRGQPSTARLQGILDPSLQEA